MLYEFILFSFCNREILSIEYNLLNLPSKVEFAGGNIIENVYAADGRKLSSYYLVQATQAQSPIERTLIIAKTTDKKTVNITDTPIKRAPTVTEIESGTHYIGNFEYLLGQNGVQETTRIHNAEGYYTNGDFFYYRRDHLGNNREVWNATQNQTVQKNDYYPSGLPFEYITPQEQPYMYNGKEFVEFGGLDEYDSEARYYYPAIVRTTTMDVYAEKYYHISPYAWCANNFMRYIDIDGRKILGTDGKEVTYTNGEWSSNASADVQRVGNAMMRTEAGTEHLNEMLHNDERISITITPEVERWAGLCERNATISVNSEGKVDLETIKVPEFKITISEGKIKELTESDIGNNQYAGFNMEDVIGAVAGHEKGHTEKENVRQWIENKYEGTTHDLEARPNQIENQIIDEIKNKK